MSGEQDMKFMGDLRSRIPITYKTMFIGMLAIAGIPGFAGFFSKDEISGRPTQKKAALTTSCG